MLKFLTVVFLSVAVMQVTATETNLETSGQNASSLDLTEPRLFIIAEMTKKILQLKLYALKSAVQESSNINEYKKQIDAIVKVSLDNIRDQVDDLKDEVKNATTQAKKSRKNISSCIRSEKRSRLRKVRSMRILKCKKSLSFNVLKLKIAELATVKIDALSIIPTCLVLHPLSNKKLKNCIQNRIDGAYSNANLIKSDIDDIAAEIYDKASNCIEDNLGNLDLDIEQISIDFERCVQKKLKDQ